ncbi:MBL fold metallo-hydrolase [Archaeoglobus neptunius]|uniref:MBL fold metallo-hydrolase n=1 Tax=Archaeoglobus neptunius TaxID=2798580 RepID=UPI001E3FD035|nr:MBL fold metallo-hydrolase [Archaeoglobus neptunius]
MYRRIHKNIYQIKPGRLSSHCYLITADLNVLIDSGTARDFPKLERELSEIGMKVKDIDIVINTHEHFDHIGGNLFLQENSVIMAHRHAAVKIIYGDDEVMMCRTHGQKPVGYRVHVWLNNGDAIDLGSSFLRVLHTPGHTSGSICLYEPRNRILFSGDTLFSSGTLSTIYRSGSLGEYFNSLRRIKTMKIDLLLPGHGRISGNAEMDIEKTIENTIGAFPDAKYLAEMFGLS